MQRADLPQGRALHLAGHPQGRAGLGEPLRRAARASDGLKPAAAPSSSCPTPWPRRSASRPEPGNPFRDGERTRRVRSALDGKIGVTSNLTARLHPQPRLRPGRGRPVRGEPHRLRDLLRGEAALLHRGRATSSSSAWPRRSPGGHFTARPALLLPPHRRARRRTRPTSRTASSRTSPRSTLDPGRGQAHREDARAACRSACWTASPREERADIDGLGGAGARRWRPSPTSSSAALQQDLRGGDTLIGLMAHRGRPRGSRTPHLAVPDRARRERRARTSRTTSATGRWLRGGQRCAASHVRGQRGGHRRGPDLVRPLLPAARQRPRDLDPTRTSLGGHGGLAAAAAHAAEQQPALPDRRRLALARVRDQRPRLHEPRRRDQPVRLGRLPVPQPVRRSSAAWSSTPTSGWTGTSAGALLRAAATRTRTRTSRTTGGWAAASPGCRARLATPSCAAGPSSLWPGALELRGLRNSDQRKKRLSRAPASTGRRADEGSGRIAELWLDLTFRPTNALNVTLSPSVGRNDRELQYVDTVPSGGEPLPVRAPRPGHAALTVRARLLDHART